MRMHAIVSVFALLLLLDRMPVLAAEEGLGAHSKHKIQTITLDGNDVRPSQATLDHADVLAFANYSAQPVRVIFTEPADLKSKVRCGLVPGTEKRAPSAWTLFTWENEKLSATVPPGQFASVCSLEPGSYTFTATSLETAGAQGGPGTRLPGKGQIVVK